MSLASAAGILLKPQTPLQQLLEDINFQRTKEMRQLLKDDSGFVVLQGTTYWTDLFVRHFLFQTEPVHSIDSDDLLFFVRKKHVKSSSRHMPKYETEVDVFRKDSRKLPIGDPDVDWEETVYLNMVIHQFDYTLTLAICTRTSPKELQVLRRHSQRVYASPSRRKMDTKGEGEEITYPHICFMVDNFDEVFSDILVRDGEMVCVELVANDKDGSVQGVIFLGSIRYDALKKVYDARQSSLSSKVAQRMSFGLFSSGAGVQTRCEFVRMKGPQGKGHAEMAVTKPKGSGVETPTSEPGFCATDMWDEWEEENDDYCTYRHQRRLSDPSANLNNFSRYAWRTKGAPDAVGGTAGAKARSENEGLDSLANEVSEIEAGDLRDDLRPAFSASEAKLHLNPNCEAANAAVVKLPISPENEVKLSAQQQAADVVDGSVPVAEAVEATAATITSPTSNTSTTGCSNCFGGKKCKRWVGASSDKNTPQMSEVYCPTCDDAANETPACLSKMPDKKSKPKHRTILSVESELIVTKRGSLRLTAGGGEKKGVVRSASLSAADRKVKRTASPAQKKEKEKEKEKDKHKVREKDKDKSKASTLLAKVSPKRIKSKTGAAASTKTKNNNDQKDTKKTQLPKESNSNNNRIEKQEATSLKAEEYELADDATSLNGTTVEQSEAKMAILSEKDTKLMINVRGREELPVVEQRSPPNTAESVASGSDDSNTTSSNKNSPYCFEKCVRVPVKSECHPLQQQSSQKTPSAAAAETFDNKRDNSMSSTTATTSTTTKATKATKVTALQLETQTETVNSDCNGNCHLISPPATSSAQRSPISPPPAVSAAGSVENGSVSDGGGGGGAGSGSENGHTNATLPRAKRSSAQHAFYHRALSLVPKRRTPDGTNIYYWCDLPRKALKELDDGAYNPLWASRGFTQTFHFWKENRRQQSTPLNAFLTYVTLPWWSIAKDLLDHRETPILTF
ncbi:uncharacterized protein LOC118744859 isoform X2 [Rhagoletis pomonella]|uniref:uncharacterized protein LOC118744859 isoform X2 n=1 Tax=Rhagoletis pomonella TaxID=28610 RepID=UPI00177B43AA|nr:uncharacterized protein LOC118744859 isoform X2 [Rhagoletis pomonella]